MRLPSNIQRGSSDKLSVSVKRFRVWILLPLRGLTEYEQKYQAKKIL